MPDGRATSAMVGHPLEVPRRRARDYLRATLGSGRVIVRTDLFRPASGWPVAAWLFLQVPAANLRHVGRQLRKLRTVRTVLSVAGPANVLVLVWLRSVSEIEGLEIAIEQSLSSVRIVDRAVVHVTRKRVGWTFDEDKRPVDVVPWVPGAHVV